MNWKRFLRNLTWIDDELTVGEKLTIGSVVIGFMIAMVGLGAVMMLGRIESHIVAGHEVGVLLVDIQKFEKYLLAMSLVGVCTAILFGYRIRRRISRPLQNLSEKSVEIGRGDISSHLEVRGKDEISQLASSFNEMIDSTSRLIKNIKDVSKEVQDASQHLAAASQELNASASQVSSTIQDIATGAQEQKQHLESSVDELQMMAGLVDAIDNTCKVAINESSSTNEIAIRCGRGARQAVDRLEGAKNVVDSSASVIYALGEKTAEIENILDVINNLAEQTNLLALNAAIEAARAGEHGRGFAVVAEEVRKLAAGSARATEKIADLIHGIQMEAENAVKAMENGTGELAEATDVVRESMNSLRGIEEAVAHLDQRITSISEAADELAKSIDVVMKAMDGTMLVVEKVAAGTEETAASMEEQTASMQELSSRAQALAALSDKLNQIVSRFKTSEDIRRAPQQAPARGLLQEREQLASPALGDGGQE